MATATMDARPAADAVAWRDFTEGLAEAERRGLPVLVSFDPGWTTAGQRLALIVDRDARLRRAMRESCVPVQVDPLDRPDLADRYQAEAATLCGYPGPPTLLTLRPDGTALIAFTSLLFEGDGHHAPSLASILLASAAALAGDLPEAGEPGAASPDHEPARQPALIDPVGLEALADRAETDAAERDRLRATLGAIIDGGVHDRIGGGFHRGSRDPGWIVPFFEKPLAENAAMAALLARAASILDEPDLAECADRTAAFVFAQLLADPDAQAIGADSDHYTFTPREFTKIVPPQASKNAAMHFHMTQAPVPHVIHAARSAEDIARTEGTDLATIRRDIALATEHLARARAARPAPPLIARPATDRTATLLEGLIRASDRGCLADGRDALATMAFDLLSAREIAPGRGWRHTRTGKRGYASDEAAARMLAGRARQSFGEVRFDRFLT